MPAPTETESLKKQVIHLSREIEELKEDKRLFREYHERLKQDLVDLRGEMDKETTRLNRKVEKITKKYQDLKVQYQGAGAEGLTVGEKEEEDVSSSDATDGGCSPPTEDANATAVTQTGRDWDNLWRELEKERNNRLLLAKAVEAERRDSVASKKRLEEENLSLRKQMAEETKQDVNYFRQLQDLKEQVQLLVDARNDNIAAGPLSTTPPATRVAATTVTIPSHNARPTEKQNEATTVPPSNPVPHPSPGLPLPDMETSTKQTGKRKQLIPSDVLSAKKPKISPAAMTTRSKMSVSKLKWQPTTRLVIETDGQVRWYYNPSLVVKPRPKFPTDIAFNLTRTACAEYMNSVTMPARDIHLSTRALTVINHRFNLGPAHHWFRTDPSNYNADSTHSRLALYLHPDAHPGMKVQPGTHGLIIGGGDFCEDARPGKRPWSVLIYQDGKDSNEYEYVGEYRHVQVGSLTAAQFRAQPESSQLWWARAVAQGHSPASRVQRARIELREWRSVIGNLWHKHSPSEIEVQLGKGRFAPRVQQERILEAFQNGEETVPVYVMAFEAYQPDSFADWYKSINTEYTESMIDLMEKKRNVSFPRLRGAASARGVGRIPKPIARSRRGSAGAASRVERSVGEERTDHLLDDAYVSDGGLSYISQ